MATDPLQPVNEYWKKKVHERDLRETKWPHDASEITQRWLSAFLESEVADFRTKPAGSSETTESVRMKVKHSSVKLQKSRPSSLTLTFASGAEGVRRLWSKAYRNMVHFRREFSRLNPTSCQALGTSYDPQQPYHFCAVSEDLCSNEDLVSFGTWAEKGMNARFAQLLYASAARTHGAFFANPSVEKHLCAGGGGLAKDSRFSPAAVDVISGFFIPSPQVDGLAGERYREQPLRTIYSALVPDLQQPVPALYGERGQQIIEHCLTRCGQRPLTLCHGELHLGNAFLNVEDNQFLFTTWRMASAAPPGTDLSVGILTSLQPCTRAQIRGIVNNYHEALVAAGADRSAYTADNCWEDFLMGCLLWCCTYPAFEVARLVNNPDMSPDRGNAPHQTSSYIPSVHARMLRNAAELDLEGFALSLLPQPAQQARPSAVKQAQEQQTVDEPAVDRAPSPAPAPVSTTRKVQVPLT